MTTFCSHLKRSAFVILMLGSFCAFSHIIHEITYIVGCFENSMTEVQLELDSDEVFYVDFERGEVVYTAPNRTDVDLSQIFQDLNILDNALKNKRVCIAFVEYGTTLEKHKEQHKDPPDIIVYTAEEVDMGVENSLICFINHFYPPFVKVTWTKNGQPVSEGVSLSRYYPNKDQTFHQFSTLNFTPTNMDIYSCTVEHMALDRPQTRFWEPDFHHQSFELDVFCAAGLLLGLLGVVAGTFLMIKALRRD